MTADPAKVGAILVSFPVVKEVEATSNPVPVVKELATIDSPDEVVVPVETPAVRAVDRAVKEMVPEVLPIATLPVLVVVLILVPDVPEVLSEIVPPDREEAPPVIVNPVEPLRSPALVIVPVPEVEILPLVVTWEPLVTGLRVGGVSPLLFQNPWVDPDPPMTEPAQVKFPVESSTVQPVEPEPPPKSIDPVPPVVAMLMLVVPVITGFAVAKVKAEEVKVLELIVELKVAAPPTLNPPDPPDPTATV